ncbi:MAG: acyl-CoA dehydratase activase, partial [candidate division WOR-3 bacterium]
MYNRMKMNLGIDIGSVSIKFAVFDKERLIRTEYLRHFGRPLEILIDFINNHSDIEYLAITGNGGRLLGELLGGVVVNEIIATVEGIKKIAPGLKTVIEIGGEDSKFFLIENNLKDFATNTICAAGTGIFLDQQAHRLNLSIDQFSSYALLSKRPSRIAGRCSVFAKSDMIHLQQIGTPMEDIIAGLCRSLARNFKSIIAQGKKFEPPIGFIGGVAANQGMVQSFESVLSLKPGELIVPKYFNCLGAIGSMYYCLETNNLGKYRGLKELHDYISKPKLTRRLPPLDGSERPAPRRSCLLPGSRIKGYLGIDVGSVSTNLVVIDSQNQVLSREYLWTQGDPIKAVQIGLDKIYKELGNLVEIVAVGTTGSGRYLIGDFVGADVIRNEITAQARAAISIDPQVDTIFEIGGQDSKFISLKDGVIVDFEMNKVCAAGTGSFLEEQSEILDTKIEDFGDTALRSKAPVFLGERCTVFMETEILHHQHQFIRKEDILAGLAYSIAGNYLNRVVQGKRIGNRIFFQGGVAANKAVVSAFEAILHKEIHVPDNFDVTGAIGVAMIARDENPNGWTRFKGFEIIQRKCRMETFECSGCSNLCDINIIELTQEEPIYYGGRCGKYEHREEKEGAKTDNYFDLRNEIFFKTENRTGETIGIPRTLIFYELFPFFNRLLTNLGFNVKLTDSTNKKIIHCGVEHSPAETCFPVKVANGHILHLIDQGIRRIFIPSVISVQKNRFFESSYVCPYVQTMPYTIRAGLSEKLGGTEIISPYLYFDRPRESIIKNLISAFNHFGIKLSEVKDAVDDAFDYNAKVNLKIKEIGEEAISKIDDIGFVIVSRPYNGYDAGINLDLARKIGEMGITAIPIDFLPLSFEDLYPEFSNMYWHYGQKLLAAASMIRHNPKLYAIYLSNFSCGPDSFLVKYFRELSGEKPFLLIELDEHSADAGLITRLEAFRDSIKGKTYITV